MKNATIPMEKNLVIPDKTICVFILCTAIWLLRIYYDILPTDENTNTQGYSLTNKNVYFCNIVYIENILQNTNITV